MKRMQVDIFPSLNTPRIYVFLQYGGMSPAQMEGFVVCQFELLFQYVDGIKEIKSRSIQQIALVEISFHPDIDMGEAMGQVVAMANRAVSRMPPGTLAANGHAAGCRQRAGRLSGTGRKDDADRHGGRRCPEHHPSAGAAKRSGHGGGFTVRSERSLDPGQVRSRKARSL